MSLLSRITSPVLAAVVSYSACVFAPGRVAGGFFLAHSSLPIAMPRTKRAISAFTLASAQA